LRLPVPGASLALGALLIAGCAGYAVEIRNVSGPAVRVAVNGQEMGTLACGAPSITLSLGLLGPGLPWEVDLFLEDGTLWRSITLDGSSGRSQVLAIFQEGVLEFPPTDPIVWDTFGRRPCPKPGDV
jgi:hypothetical protein